MPEICSGPLSPLVLAGCVWLMLPAWMPHLQREVEWSSDRYMSKRAWDPGTAQSGMLAAAVGWAAPDANTLQVCSGPGIL